GMRGGVILVEEAGVGLGGCRRLRGDPAEAELTAPRPPDLKPLERDVDAFDDSVVLPDEQYRWARPASDRARVKRPAVEGLAHEGDGPEPLAPELLGERFGDREIVCRQRVCGVDLAVAPRVGTEIALVPLAAVNGRTA